MICIDSMWPLQPNKYKWTLITLCTLQASCRHFAGQAKIQLLVWNHTSPIEKSRNIVGYSYRETKTCSEKSMARALRYLVYRVGKVMGWCWKSHVFKSWLENMIFSAGSYYFTHCVHQLTESPGHFFSPTFFYNRSCFHRSFNPKNIPALKNIFH